jgi:hypothetical protein
MRLDTAGSGTWNFLRLAACFYLSWFFDAVLGDGICM